MALLLKSTVLSLSLFGSTVLASCGYGTHLTPRAEGGIVVESFGYVGVNVSLPFYRQELFN